MPPALGATPLFEHQPAQTFWFAVLPVVSSLRQRTILSTWRLAFLVLCSLHRTLLLDRCQSCGMAVCYERQTAKESSPRWILTQCYRCRTDLRKFATHRYRRPVDSAELEFAVFLQTALQRGWVEMPRNEVIYSHLFFTGIHQIMRRLTYGRMAQPLKAALYRSYAIDLPIDYLPGFLSVSIYFSDAPCCRQSIGCCRTGPIAS